MLYIYVIENNIFTKTVVLNNWKNYDTPVSL